MHIGRSVCIHACMRGKIKIHTIHVFMCVCVFVHLCLRMYRDIRIYV